ncbi:MAG: aminoglycoside phosphotransferase family protein [Oscillospiraceae bacterium]|jgi:aminoglycoside 2''-phosphotransferase|nr:aminoglycoside phosphotransferase family protein [Oscillospiraceae bacterium]
MQSKETKYRDYIVNRFPGIPPDSFRFDFTSSQHSDLVFAGKETVFKFSKYDWTAAYLKNEWRTVQLIRHLTTIPLPAVDLLETGVLKCSVVHGKVFQRSDILLQKKANQDILAKQIGTFFRQLHSVPVEKAKQSGLNDCCRKMNAEYWGSEYEAICRKLFDYCDDYSKETIRRIFEPALKNSRFFMFTPSLIHGGFTPRHVLYNDATLKVKAVTGFGGACVGDPAYDMGTFLAGTGESFLKRVGKYDVSVAQQIDRARFYAFVQRLMRAKELADRITTRDFSGFQLCLDEPDLLPPGKPF